ncbi:MAG TPA: hypothetical protein PKB10_08215, partial [Tepidisphaeraceae bacterium]|nr:hypothetical protein [Tepidisphaeraceae bacterium]
MAAVLDPRLHSNTEVASQWGLMWWSFRRLTLAMVGLAAVLFLYLVGKGEKPGASPKRPARPAADTSSAASPLAEPDARARYQILYWQDIPSAVKAWDDAEEVRGELAARFGERIDVSAQRQGHVGGEAYTA